jgi:apocytochrome f
MIAVLRIPYDMQLKQVLANGKKGGLNVGQIGGRQLQL